MPPPTSKKAETLRAESKKLEDTAKKKFIAIVKTEKAEEENTKLEIQQIGLELNNFKKKADNVMSGKAENTGWDEQAVKVCERMKQLVENEALIQHNLLLKTDEATAELELKAKPIKKELPLISDFSEEDRVQILQGIDKSIHKLKEKREAIEIAEGKLNRQMQVLMEYTPSPTEDKQTILGKLQMSYDVVSGANDPDRARNELLRQLSPFRDDSNVIPAAYGPKKPHQKATNPNGPQTSRTSNPAVQPNALENPSRSSKLELPPSSLRAISTSKAPPQPLDKLLKQSNLEMPPTSNTQTPSHPSVRSSTPNAIQQPSNSHTKPTAPSPPNPNPKPHTNH